MKNIKFIAGLLFMGMVEAVIAAPKPVVGNQTINQTDCALLGSPVNLGVSSGVIGAYECTEANNFIQVGACHTGGSRKQGAACAFITKIEDGQEVQTDQLPAGCEKDSEGNPATPFSTIPNYKAFIASSSGGVIQEKDLGGRCTSTSLSAVDGFGK